MEDKKFSLKKGLGSGEDATKRRVDKKAVSTRNKRRDVLDGKRKPLEIAEPVSGDVASYIRSINYDEFMASPTPLGPLNKLVNLLKSTKQSEPYYGPCAQLYPEHVGGPFLFSDDKTIARIVYLASVPDPEISRLATQCMVFIAGHEQRVVWVNKLVRLGALPVLFASPHRTHALRALENMCTDNPETRDLILDRGVVPIVCACGPELLESVAFFFVSLFKHGDALPAFSKVVQLWDLMVNRVLFEHFSNGRIDHHAHMAVSIMHAVNLVTRYNFAYHTELVSNARMMDRIRSWCSPDVGCDLVVNVCAQILCTLTENETVHARLDVAVYTQLLMYPDAGVRIQAALSFENIASNPIFLKSICSEPVMNAIRMQSGNAGIVEVNTHVYMTICMAVLTAEEADLQSVAYPHLLKLIDRLCMGLIKMETNLNVVAKILEAIRAFVRWNAEQTKLALEDNSGLEQIERMAYHLNPIIQHPSETIMNMLDGTMEIMD